jgi:hypothetical protein
MSFSEMNAQSEINAQSEMNAQSDDAGPFQQILHFINTTIDDHQSRGSSLPGARTIIQGSSDTSKTMMAFWKLGMCGGEEAQSNTAACSPSSAATAAAAAAVEEEEEGEKQQKNGNNEEDPPASQRDPTQKSTQEVAEESGGHGDFCVSATHSETSIEKLKPEAAKPLIRLSCSIDSNDSAKSAHAKISNRVQFADAIVSQVRERPRTDSDDVGALFYTISDIERFEFDADESSCEGSSFSSSFSYTITPTPSQGEHETDENDTPVATEPAMENKITGTDPLVVSEANEGLVAHGSNIYAPTHK